MRLFLVDPVEIRNGESVSDVYSRKLKESKKTGIDVNLIGRNYGYGRYSLYRSIKDNWVKSPIDVYIKDRLIYDGLHRIACAYNIDPDRVIPVRYI